MNRKIIEISMGNGNYQFPTNSSMKSNAHHSITKDSLLSGWKSQCSSKRSSLNASSEPSSLETIDRAMDIQQILFEFSQIVNSYYKFQLLIVILTAFIIIVFDCYYLLEVLNNPAQHFRLSKMESIIYLGYQLLTNGLNVLGLVVSCSLLQNAARETGHIVHKIIVVTKDMILRERLMQFSMQLSCNQPVFTAFGLFSIDGSLIYAIAGATTTYLVILVQFSNPAATEVSTNGTTTN